MSLSGFSCGDNKFIVQGYGQQTWGGPQASHGYGVPPQGYGGYGPTPYGYQGSVEGFGRQPQDTQVENPQCSIQAMRRTNDLAFLPRKTMD